MWLRIMKDIFRLHCAFGFHVWLSKKDSSVTLGKEWCGKKIVCAKRSGTFKQCVQDWEIIMVIFPKRTQCRWWSQLQLLQPTDLWKLLLRECWNRCKGRGSQADLFLWSTSSRWEWRENWRRKNVEYAIHDDTCLPIFNVLQHVVKSLLTDSRFRSSRQFTWWSTLPLGRRSWKWWILNQRSIARLSDFPSRSHQDSGTVWSAMDAIETSTNRRCCTHKAHEPT